MSDFANLFTETSIKKECTIEQVIRSGP